MPSNPSVPSTLREPAEQADVPALRSYRADDVPSDVFPVLVKAASDGGKGMRIVRDPEASADALGATEISGLTTNPPFLRALLGSAEFADAAIDTSWPSTHPDLPFHRRLGPDGRTLFDARDGWRLGGPALPARASAERRAAADAASAEADGSVRAPMPGTVLAVKARPGQTVAAGEALGVLEAIRMEHTLTAPCDGGPAEAGASVGGQVPPGHLLFHVEREATR